MKPKITVCCVKWGDKYSSKYVRILNAMVKRNTTIPYNFVCFTDNPAELGDINHLPIPNIEGKEMKHWWGIISVFRKEIEGMPETDKILFLGLDIVIVDNIDCILNYDSDFVVLRDWTSKGEFRYNSSVFLFDYGKFHHIWDEFSIKNMKMYSVGGDQAWIFSQYKKADIFPKGWIKSAKSECHGQAKSKGVKILYFHGSPKPKEAIDKNIFSAGWLKNYWHE